MSVSQDVSYCASTSTDGGPRSAPAVQRNREPILGVLAKVLDAGSVDGEHNAVLEIGSGTGEHAVYFGERLPHVHWQTSDLAVNHPHIQAWLDVAKLANVAPPLELDAAAADWQLPEALAGRLCAVFLANVFHIVSWPLCLALVGHVAAALRRSAAPARHFLAYGPFNYAGAYTSDSNEKFDAWLKARDPLSGIRNSEDVVAAAAQHGLQLVADYEMPANNRILHFQLV